MSDTTPSPGATKATSSRLPLILGIAVLVILVAGFGGWYAFIRNDSPPAANISTATQGITVGSTRATTSTSAVSSTTATSTSNGGTGSASSAPTSAAPTTTGGETWTINSSVTSDAGGNFSGFRIDEVLSNIGSATAVGRSTEVSGSLTFDGATLVSGSFTVDMTALATDKSQRDSRMKSALETSRFPTSTFVVRGPVSLGATPGEGATVSVEVPGTFTIHGVSKDVSVKVDATVTNGVLAVVGSTTFTLADYDITAPSAPSVVSIEDHGTIEFQLYLTKA